MDDYREPGWDTPAARSQRAVWTTTPTATAGPESIATTPHETGVPSSHWRVAPPSPRSQWMTRLRGVTRAAFWLLATLSLVVVGLVFAYRWIAPPMSMLMLGQRLVGTSITRIWRPLDQISPHLARAVIMSEDAGFCGHRGVDFTELERAYERGLDGGSRNGASTISMQLTKNLFLWPSKSYVRKAIEIPLTLVADQWWGKRRTMELYLNTVEWGRGIFGAEAAARVYFHKSARDLTDAESALMAVALPNPRVRNPGQPAAQQRRMAGVVLGRMQNGARNVRCLPAARTSP